MTYLVLGVVCNHSDGDKCFALVLIYISERNKLIMELSLHCIGLYHMFFLCLIDLMNYMLWL